MSNLPECTSIKSTNVKFIPIICTITTLNIEINRSLLTVKTLIGCHRMQHLIRVYTVCHTYNNILDISTGSRMDYFKFKGKYGKQIRCPKLRVNTVCTKDKLLLKCAKSGLNACVQQKTASTHSVFIICLFNLWIL